MTKKTYQSMRSARPSSEALDLQAARETFPLATLGSGAEPTELDHGGNDPSEDIFYSSDKETQASQTAASSSTVVTILGLAEEEELLSSAATELARLQPALFPTHVDNLEHAVAQKNGPQMIRDLIDVRDALSKIPMLWAVRRQRRGMPRLSSGGSPKKGDLFSAVNFLKKLKMEDRAVSPLLYNFFLEAFVASRKDGVLRHFEEMQRVDCLNIVSYNTLLKRTSTQVASTKLRS